MRGFSIDPALRRCDPIAVPTFLGVRGAMAVPVADLIAHLDGVRATGPGKWLAKCPAHEDRSPSLTIARGRDDDRWLVHCWAGCDPIEVMQAIGLELADLYDDHEYRPRGDRERPRVSARDALVALDHEIHVAAIITADVIEHREINDETWTRLATAARRIGQARAMCGPDVYMRAAA